MEGCKDMSNISPFGTGWYRKKELAERLGVHPRTINNMVGRKEVERREIEGVVWFRLFQLKGGESQACNPASPVIEGESALSPHESLLAMQAEFHAQIARERARVEELLERNASLGADLAQAQTALVHVTRERDALRRVVETQRRGWWGWFKRMLVRFLGQK